MRHEWRSSLVTPKTHAFELLASTGEADDLSLCGWATTRVCPTPRKVLNGREALCVDCARLVEAARFRANPPEGKPRGKRRLA